MNAEETKEFIAMWHDDLDRLDSLSITAWLRAYTNIDYFEDGSGAMQLQARVDAKLNTAADTIDQLTKERDEARRIACELKTTNQQGRYSFAIIMGWDCYKEKA